MDLTQLLPYCIALGIAAAIPGPGVIALIARALGSGFRHGLAFAGGLILGDLTFLGAACFGLAMIAAALGELFLIVRIAASIYLAYLAWKLWRSTGLNERMGAVAEESVRSSFSAGYLITLSNPKTIVFYLALMPTVIDLGSITPAIFGLLVVATTLILLLVMLPYAALAASARGVLTKPAIMRGLNRSAATILMGTAVWTLVRRS
ncbi:LysE family translocator [Limoniibacter endophyticus]|nr:LysE family translocator [Limoniibacter endophyticus]